MMIGGEELKELIINRYGNIKRFSEEAQIPRGTVIAILQKGLASSSFSTVCKVCAGLNISLEEASGKSDFDYAESRRLYELYLNAPEMQPAINALLHYKPKSN